MEMGPAQLVDLHLEQTVKKGGMLSAVQFGELLGQRIQFIQANGLSAK